jgi:hypothetical protein
MLPYKIVNIESFDEIQKQLTKVFFSTTNTIITRSYITDKNSILSQIPALKDFLLENNLHWGVCRFFTTKPNTDIPIHVDGSEEYPKFLALNLPLFGCENSLMQWWDNVELVSISNTEEYANNIKIFDSPNKTVSHSLELSLPHLVRIDLPHNIVNLKDTPRAIFSMRFKPEPLHLWY